MKTTTGSVLHYFHRVVSGARSREGQGEERQGSGARRRQEEIHHRVTSLTGPSFARLVYRWSSTLAAPTDNNAESDCLLRSCRGVETEDVHGESRPLLFFLFKKPPKNCCCTRRADVFHTCPPLSIQACLALLLRAVCASATSPSALSSCRSE